MIYCKCYYQNELGTVPTLRL